MSTLKRDAYHHGDLRETLIDLALEALEADGPESLSLRLLAARAGVSGMAPYRHFEDKAALMAAVARRGFAMLAAEYAAADRLKDPRARLTKYAVAYVEFAAQRPGLFATMFGAAPPTPDEETASPDSAYAKFDALIAELSPPERRNDLFLTSWAAVHGLACLCLARRLRGNAEKPAELARRVAATLSELFVDLPSPRQTKQRA